MRACVQSLLSSNLRVGVIRSCGAAPFSSDSMLTALQKAPKKRLGLAVSFPISRRPARSWTQLMANNYQGYFSMTAPGGLMAATGSGRPAVNQDASLLPLVLIFFLVFFFHWLAAGLIGNDTLQKEIPTVCHCFGSHLWAHGVVSVYAAASYRTWSACIPALPWPPVFTLLL